MSVQYSVLAVCSTSALGVCVGFKTMVCFLSCQGSKCAAGDSTDEGKLRRVGSTFRGHKTSPVNVFWGEWWKLFYGKKLSLIFLNMSEGY